MEMDDEERLDRAFARAREKAAAFASKRNSKLPAAACPQCSDSGHVPGLRCPSCGYKHSEPWSIVLDTEWGYAVVALTNRRMVFAEFKVRLK